MLLLRSIIYNVVFYLSISVQMIFWLPSYFFMKREDCWKVVRLWAKSCLWFQHHIVGTRFDFSGLENLPKDRGFILAAKHQSAWETFAVLPFLTNPSYILKRELMFIPVFGWYAAKAKVIPVNRGKRALALMDMSQKASQQLAAGYQIIIYPEGTRVRPWAAPKYKYGIAHMYSELDCPVVPGALNSGIFWPRQSFMRFSGTISLKFLPIIEPGLEQDAFRQRLQDDIEDASNALMDATLNWENPPPLAKGFKARANQ